LRPPNPFIARAVGNGRDAGVRRGRRGPAIDTEISTALAAPRIAAYPTIDGGYFLNATSRN